MLWMPLIFLITALIYASVGFGGGSTYIALLALIGTDCGLFPIIALLCNIIVVTGGTIRFQLADQIPWRRIWPILLLSVPAAWAGGRIAIEKEHFLLLLALSLTAAGLLLLIEPWIKQRSQQSATAMATFPGFTPLAGGAIGFLSGLVGIGGGIFLSPLLLLTRWAASRQVAATASVFILVNSISGLLGQWQKSGSANFADAIASFWPLFVAVFIGGQIGSLLASRKLPETMIRQLTALLILYVSIRIIWQYVSGDS